jgi:hypothetical protein
MTDRKSVTQKTNAYRPFAAAMLLACSGVISAQSSPPSVCHMDSDGFCVTGAIETAPLLSAVQQNKPRVALTPAPQNKLQFDLSAAPQNKLHVEFRNNLLRIDAENTTLRDALKAVSDRTGAEIQFPAGQLNERIFVHLGPGSPRDVVAQLLNGSPFNYLILSSASEPGGIARLVLTANNVAHESTTSEAPAALPSNNSAVLQLYGAGFSVDPDAVAAEPSPEPAAVAAPGGSPAANWTGNNGSKLSSEDLDRMQKMQIQQEQQQFALQLQQQRQQQQQEQPSQNSPPQ